MTEKLKIEFGWLDQNGGSDIDRAFYANIGLAVGKEYLTRIDDLRAKTVRNHMRGGAWSLATWFAANWWRLRWEPAPDEWTKDKDWLMSHSIAAAGGGYVWPRAIFASDGDFVEIAAAPKTNVVPFEPIRYINHMHGRVRAAEFEKKVDDFIESVLSRMQALELKVEGLPGLWEEVLGERSDSNASKRRKLEAMAGFDPDQVPEMLLTQLLEAENHLGKSATEELAAGSRHATDNALKSILDLNESKAEPRAGGFRASMPELGTLPGNGHGSGLPWQQAFELARLARQKWGLGNGPILNKALAKLLATKPEFLSNGAVAPIQMPVALRAGTNGIFDIYFDRSNPTTRRFAVSRLIGDHVYFANQERLLPATRAKTSRQKFQRAFAQEFLCPIDALMETIKTEKPGDDDISDAAAHFHVSPLMVRTTLVNKGELDREALTWSD